MADFDLSLIIRAQDQGAAAAGDKLAKSLDGVATAQSRVNSTGNDAATGTGKAAAGLDREAAAAKAAVAPIGSAAAAQRQLSTAGLQASTMMYRSSLSLGDLTRSLDNTKKAAQATAPAIAAIGTKSTIAAGSARLLSSGVSLAAGLIGGLFTGALIGAVGYLVSLAFRSDKATKSTRAFGDGMDFAALSARELIKAIGDLEEAERKSIRTTYEMEQAKLADGRAALFQARANREAAKSALENAIRTSENAPREVGEGAAAVRLGRSTYISGLKSQLADLNASIGSAESLLRLAQIPVIQREITAETDASAAATEKYNAALLDLDTRFKGTDLRGKKIASNLLISDDEYRAGLKRITEIKEAEIKAAREAERVRRPTTGLPNVTRDEVARLIGTTINPGGGLRSPAANKRAGGAANSYHLSGTAIDIPLTVNGQPLTKESIRAALEPAGVAIKELLGPGDKNHSDHFHIAFAKGRRGADQMAAATERARAQIARAAEQIENFGERAGESIARINDQFDEQPRLVDAAAKATRGLDQIIKDLGEQKPLGFAGLIKDAERAKIAVAEGINRPYNDFIKSQDEALAIQRLLTAGRHEEAEAVRIILGLERQMGPLTPARRDAVLATVQALRAEEKQLEINRQKQQKYLDQLDSVKSAVRSIFDDPIQGLKDLPKRLIAAAGQFKADQLFESLFGDTFRKLEDQITGANSAKDSAERMAAAVDGVTASARRVEAAFNGAAGAVQGQPAGGSAPVITPEGEIVVTGKRPTGLPQILEKLGKGIGISDDGAKKIGKIGGDALAGAATGAMTNTILKPLGKALGFKTSAMGAQVGGAIGQLTGIPGGDIIGSIIGSIVGGLFKKTKKGSATITNVFDDPSAKGNFKGITTALASSIQDSLLNIADALGGGLGDFAVSIGKRKDKFVVDPSGRGKTKGSGTKKFKDEEDAIRFAILDAIRDGAVTGLSAAVKTALQGSDDLERALREALKVQDLEDLIAGVGGSLSREFKNFDRLAADRVRVAKKYGLDLVAVERINGEERAKLIENITISRIGSLIQFQKDMKFGDLFEGDAQTRRAGLLEEIAKVQAKAEAGSEGAADQLASLFRQLIETSKEAFGTAGPELVGDRALATSGVDRVIEMENARIAAAQAWQDSSLAAANENNTLTNETNNLIATGNTLLDAIRAHFAGAGAGGGGGATAGATAPDYTAIGGGGVGRFTNLNVAIV